MIDKAILPSDKPLQSGDSLRGFFHVGPALDSTFRGRERT